MHMPYGLDAIVLWRIYREPSHLEPKFFYPGSAFQACMNLELVEYKHDVVKWILRSVCIKKSLKLRYVHTFLKWHHQLDAELTRHCSKHCDWPSI
jgi:hypothetical protein